MLNRIYENNFEDTHFPLLESNTVFKDDLISSMSILVPEQRRLYLYYVGVDSKKVTVDIGHYVDGKLEQFAYCVYNKTEHRVAGIKSYSDDCVIGYICFGSGINYPGEYIGPTEIDPSCLVIDSGRTVSVIDGTDITTPDYLDVKNTGVLDMQVCDGVCTLSFNGSIDGSSLDGRDRSTFGCISTVNNQVVPDHTLSLMLPDGFHISVEDLKSDSILDPYTEEPLNRYIITIHSGSSYSGNYGCSDRDPIIDILMDGYSKDMTDDDHAIVSSPAVEKPLDKYLKEYKKWRTDMMSDDSSSSDSSSSDSSSSDSSSSDSSSSDSSSSAPVAIDDTAVIDNNDVYTKEEQTMYKISTPVSIASNILVHAGHDGSTVLIKQHDNTWEE